MQRSKGFNRASYEDWLKDKIASIDTVLSSVSDAYLKDHLIMHRYYLEHLLEGRKPKLAPRERIQFNWIVDPRQDCLLSAIRKNGGIDVTLGMTNESFWAGRLNGVQPFIFGLPYIERKGDGRYPGKSLERHAEHLHELGYLGEYDWHELDEKLGVAQDGEPVYSDYVDTSVLEAAHYEEIAARDLHHDEIPF